MVPISIDGEKSQSMGPYFEGRRCWFCGRKTKQQFLDIFHCKCGKSYIKKGGGRWEAFDRTGDMVFGLHRTEKGKKRTMIRYKGDTNR